MSIKKKLFHMLPYAIVDNYENRKRNKFSAVEPSIYNSDGQKMSIIYLQDDLCYYYPYSMAPGRLPKYILWDRYNNGLSRHVYTHKNILKTCGKPSKKYALFLESKAIMPQDYEIFENNHLLAKEFDIIFTHSQKLLNELDNARWIPGGHVWYGGIDFGGKVSTKLYLEKTKNISMVSSGKKFCDLHLLRIETVKKLQKMKLVDGYGTFPGTVNGDTLISETLQEYRYSIVFENNIEDYYFTEKILNCFEAMTIPIYLGARKISNYFNADGIIELQLKDIDRIEDIVKNLNEEYYSEHIEAILDNFNRVQEYLCLEDFIYNRYLKT